MRELFTSLLLLDFKLMSKNDEIEILDQAKNFIFNMVFISKENFMKIKFWFEPEKSVTLEGNFNK